MLCDPQISSFKEWEELEINKSLLFSDFTVNKLLCVISSFWARLQLLYLSAAENEHTVCSTPSLQTEITWLYLSHLPLLPSNFSSEIFSCLPGGIRSWPFPFWMGHEIWKILCPSFYTIWVLHPELQRMSNIWRLDKWAEVQKLNWDERMKSMSLIYHKRQNVLRFALLWQV